MSEHEIAALSIEEEQKAKRKAYKRAWYLANKEREDVKIKARNKASYHANKEANCARAKAWSEANKERRAESRKAYRETNRESMRTYDKVYAETHKEQKAATDKARHNKDKEYTSSQFRAWWIKKKYGLSLDQFAHMITSQNNRCACCKSLFGILKETRPCVDHCHQTGQIRGILCGSCNLLLGHAHDSAKTLRACARYLERSIKT